MRDAGAGPMSLAPPSTLEEKCDPGTELVEVDEEEAHAVTVAVLCRSLIPAGGAD